MAYPYLLLVFLGGLIAYTESTSGIAVRLKGGGDTNVGRVEVLYAGMWGAVCADPNWGSREANVTCRMLGYSDGKPRRERIKYGYPTSPIWMNHVYCNGTEEHLTNCSFSGWAFSSSCRYPAGVFCYNSTASSDIAVRLTGGPDTNVGRVEVFYAGMWGAVCADPNWNNKEANVTCRMFGYSNGVPRRDTITYGYPTSPIWMNHVYCNGTEEHLTNCSFSGWAFSSSCRYPAGVFCYNSTASSDIAVRLTGGRDTNVGRVEVFYAGMWGAVCADPNWNNKEANVTCRMFGYSNGVPRRDTIKYGYPTSPIWMNHVYCNGTEEHLTNCSFSGWAFSHSCSYPASVFCYNSTASSDIAVRLTGGRDTNVGRVEVFYAGMWGAVCADPNWNNKEANVTCRMFGYSNGVPRRDTTKYGYPTSPVWMNHVYCNGTEEHLTNCSFSGWAFSHSCSYPASVFCYNSTASSDIAVRLTGGRDTNVGRVEVFYAGMWGAVCAGPNWNNKEANVTCRMFGYSNGVPRRGTIEYGYPTSPIWMNHVYCNGTEEHLTNCSFSGWAFSHSCFDPAGVFCYNSTASSDIAVRLTGGRDTNAGRVEVFYAGMWGAVCADHNWNNKEANVTCRMFGYSNGVPRRDTTKYGYPTSPVWMNHVYCNGTEEHLTNCSFSGWAFSHSCSYPASVFCYNSTASSDIAVRLTGGRDTNVGRVEVFYAGMWGAVCADPNWNNKEANVTCRMFGYSNGVPRRERSLYGYPTSPVWMNHVYCNGTEEYLTNCSFSGWAFSSSCYYPAGVFCYSVNE